MCPMARGSAILRGELQCCHVSHGPRRAVHHRNKERLSCPRHTGRLACFQGTLMHYWSACRRAGRYSASQQCSVSPANDSWTWLQRWYDPTGWHHGTGHVECSRAIKQDGSTLLTSCKTSFVTPSRCALQHRVRPALRPPVGPQDSL
jgi:hypothetical protein